jgi:hypothetical protein
VENLELEGTDEVDGERTTEEKGGGRWVGGGRG